MIRHASIGGCCAITTASTRDATPIDSSGSITAAAPRCISEATTRTLSQSSVSMPARQRTSRVVAPSFGVAGSISSRRSRRV